MRYRQLATVNDRSTSEELASAIDLSLNDVKQRVNEK
jgi:hypothetical protein